MATPGVKQATQSLSFQAERLDVVPRGARGASRDTLWAEPTGAPEKWPEFCLEKNKWSRCLTKMAFGWATCWITMVYYWRPCPTLEAVASFWFPHSSWSSHGIIPFVFPILPTNGKTRRCNVQEQAQWTHDSQIQILYVFLSRGHWVARNLCWPRSSQINILHNIPCGPSLWVKHLQKESLKKIVVDSNSYQVHSKFLAFRVVGPTIFQWIIMLSWTLKPNLPAEPPRV